MLQENILQHFRPSLSGYHLSLRPWFCLSLSDRLKLVLLNVKYIEDLEEELIAITSMISCDLLSFDNAKCAANIQMSIFQTGIDAHFRSHHSDVHIPKAYFYHICPDK